MGDSTGWATDSDLVAARDAFAARIPGYRTPIAYALARQDNGRLVFGHINRVGEVRGLPAAALALECGYSSHTGSFVMTREQVLRVLTRIAPAEAATHIPHPNIWTWRELLADADEGSRFLAFFLADAADPACSDEEAQFRELAVGG